MKFQLDLAQFGEFKKALLIRTIPLLLFPLIAVLIFNRTDWTTAVFLILIFIVIITFVIRNAIKKQRKAWETFELLIDDTKIERNQQGFPGISITKTDIVEAIEAKNGSITLMTRPKANSIIIPFSVQNKVVLKEVISTFTTIREVKKNYGLLLSYGGAILGLVLFFSFMLSTNFYLTISSGLVLFSLCIWGFIATQRNKNIDKKVKRSSYVIIILLIVIASKLFITMTQ